MRRLDRTGRVGMGIVVALAALGLFGLGHWLSSPADRVPYGAAVAWADGAEPALQAQVEPIERAELPGGRVLLGEREVAVLVIPAAGLSAWERAHVVALRLNQQLREGLSPADVIVRLTPEGARIELANMLLVTVTTEEARLLEAEPAALAISWARNIRAALGDDSNPTVVDERPSAGPTETPAAEPMPTERTTPEAEPYTDKIVPILSLLEGTRIGVARINGPASRVALTQAVVQFSINFRKFLEIDIYVPISTKTPGRTLDRVQGVGVTGLGDIRL